MKELKAMYQEKADEMANERFDKDFYELDEENRCRIYNEAMVWVNEELICRADSLRDELWLQGKANGVQEKKETTE